MDDKDACWADSVGLTVGNTTRWDSNSTTQTFSFSLKENSWRALKIIVKLEQAIDARFSLVPMIAPQVVWHAEDYCVLFSLHTPIRTRYTPPNFLYSSWFCVSSSFPFVFSLRFVLSHSGCMSRTPCSKL